MKHTVSLLTIILFIALLPVFCTSESKDESTPSPILTAEDADAFIRVFLNGDASSLDGEVLMTEQMAQAVKKSGGFQGLAASLKAMGKAGRIYPVQEMELGALHAYRIPCRFSLIPLDLVLTVQDGALAGLVTAEFTGVEAEDSGSVSKELYSEQELPLPVPALNGELPGTLLLPDGDGPFPAVVLVHGSGPNDRDETMTAQKPFRDIAEGLAEAGIAVYRYDKRTYAYGAALAGDTALTLREETIDDAAAAVQLLAAQEKIDKSRIFVLGHSLGAMAVPAINEALMDAGTKACGFILMAPSARPLDQLMKDQLDYLYSLLPAISEEQRAVRERLFADLEQLKDLDELPDDTLIAGAYAPYWRWLDGYDPLESARGITGPCLLLQGEEDYQVTMEDYSLWQAALKDLPNWQLISYPGLVHSFTKGQKPEGSAAYMRSEKVSQEVINDIAGFITQ